MLVLLVTGGILVFGAWGSKQMKVEFDPFNLTPADSYVKMFKGAVTSKSILVGHKSENMYRVVHVVLD